MSAKDTTPPPQPPLPPPPSTNNQEKERGKGKGTDVITEGGTKQPTNQKSKTTTTIANTTNEKESKDNNDNNKNSNSSEKVMTKEQQIQQAKSASTSSISEFESERRGYYIPLVKSNQKYWNALVATAEKSKLENERMFEFLTRRILIDAKYSEALQELPNLDLGTQLGKMKIVLPESKTGTTTNNNKKKNDGEEEEEDDDDDGQKLNNPQLIMNELVGCTESLGERYSQYVASVQADVITNKMSRMITSFRTRMDSITSEGCEILDIFIKAERMVQVSYDEYGKAVSSSIGTAKASSTDTDATTLDTKDPRGSMRTSRTSSLSSKDKESRGSNGIEQSTLPDSTTYNTISCLWIADMKYRHAVTTQKFVENLAKETFSYLFKSMKTLELERRKIVHSILGDFIEQQGNLFANLPPLASASLLRLSALKPDAMDVEHDVRREIKKLARGKTSNNNNSSSSSSSTLSPSKQSSKSMNGPAIKSSGTAASNSSINSTDHGKESILGVSNNMITFENHLKLATVTSLVNRCQLVQYRAPYGLLKRWKLCILLHSIDNFIHVLGLPDSFSSNQSIMTEHMSKSVDEIFKKALLPTPPIFSSPEDRQSRMTSSLLNSPTKSSKNVDVSPKKVKSKAEVDKESKAISAWIKSLKDTTNGTPHGLIIPKPPLFSLYVPLSKAQFLPLEGDNVFEVEEKVENKGIIKVFKTHEVKKVVLKAATQEDMVDWCITVNH